MGSEEKQEPNAREAWELEYQKASLRDSNLRLCQEYRLSLSMEMTCFPANILTHGEFTPLCTGHVYGR